MNDLAIQKFDNDELENKFFEIYKKLLNQALVDVDSMLENIYQSSILGKALYDKKVMPIYSIIAESIFVNSFYAFMNAQLRVGSINSYCEILYSIFGSNAEIEIDKDNPFHIKINLIAKYLEYFIWVNEEKTVYLTTEDGEYLGFASLVARITQRQLAEILKRMTNAGVFLEFTYEQGSPD